MLAGIPLKMAWMISLTYWFGRIDGALSWTSRWLSGTWATVGG